MTYDLVTQCASEIADAITAIQQPRTDFELEHFVVGQHDTEPRRYSQCVLEMQVKLQALKRAAVIQRQTRRAIQRLHERGTPAAIDKAELLQIDIEDQELATIGALRELNVLYSIFKAFPKQYSRDELNEAESQYWKARLLRQAGQDITAFGRIGVGNQDALRQIGLPVGPSTGYISTIEQRFLAVGEARIVVVVPTLMSRGDIRAYGLECLNGWNIPGTFQQIIHVVDGRPVDAAYTAGVQWAMENNADFILCVEDDHIVPPGAFEALWTTFKAYGPKAIVGAWYPQKKDPRTGTPIVVRDGQRTYLQDDGSLHEVYSIPQGFTLIPASIFRELPQPWFVTTDCLTQDSFFSQLAREIGYRLFVDTSIRCSHVDRRTGRVFR